MRGPDGAETLPGCEAPEWWERFEVGTCVELRVRLTRGPGGTPTRANAGAGGLPGVRLADLVTSGESLRDRHRGRDPPLAEPRWRRRPGSFPRRRGGGRGLVREVRPRLSIRPPQLADGGILVFEIGLLDANPGLVAGFDNVATLDPPSSDHAGPEPALGDGLLHPLSGPSELEFTETVVTYRFDLAGRLRELFRTLKDADLIRGELLRNVLIGAPEDPRSPEQAATLVRILEEVGLIRSEGHGDARGLGVVSSGKVNLADSPTFAGQAERQKEQLEFLRQSKRSMN